MTYHPPSMVSYHAQEFIEAALKTESQCPPWLLLAMKTCENPALVDGIIVTSQIVDWDDEEHDEPESYDRREYEHLLPKKKETQETFITTGLPRMLHLLDVSRQFRLDIRFHVVLHVTNNQAEIIDILDVEIANTTLNPTTSEMMIDWFENRKEELEAAREMMDRVPHLRLVVVNR
jgi:hypothetical protein